MCFDVDPIVETTPAVRKCWILFFKNIDTTIFFVSYSCVEVTNITRAILKDGDEFYIFWKLESGFFPSFQEFICRLVADIIPKEKAVEGLIFGI